MAASPANQVRADPMLQLSGGADLIQHTDSCRQQVGFITRSMKFLRM